MKHKFIGLVILSMVLGVTGPAVSVPITLTFEGLQQQEPILNYYNGGLGGNSSGPGPNYGIIFGASSLALNSGSFANNPTPPSIVFFMSGSAMMNVPGGFDTGFSFYYASNQAAPVTVWDGLDGTGNLLETINLPATPNPWYVWDIAGVSFAGTAKSVNFGGGANQTGFDDITLGSPTPGPGPSPNPIPAPGAILLAGIGATAVGWLRRRRTI